MATRGELPEDWQRALAKPLKALEMLKLKEFLGREKKLNKQVFPTNPLIFRAFHLTPLDAVKVVILGQDPYHGDGQAHGLSFSVPQGVAIPPSLANIFKEQERDLGIQQGQQGCLESWAKQGVLLLNAILTVERQCAGSHRNQGWENFTDQVIQEVSAQREGVVFLLWGGYARKKASMIDRQKHLVLESPHPSPLSAYRGFLGNGHFSKTNVYLQSLHKQPITWQL